jgi:hypothetical protein
MTDGREFLDCPACGELCTAIPSCQVAHLDCMAEVPRNLDHSWCEDRVGTCACGAKLHVDVDDGRAHLEEDDEP